MFIGDFTRKIPKARILERQTSRYVNAPKNALHALNTMRPCNQCRKPVKNAAQLCDDCQQHNAERNVEPKPTVSLTPVDTNNLAPVPFVSTVNVMLLSIGVCFGLMGLLIGVLCGSMIYALIGFGAGWLIAASLVPIFR